MRDLISKSALLEEFFKDTPHCQYVGVKYVDDLIKKQPTIEPKADWISCEERLPEANVAVLVSTNTGEVDVDYYGSMVKDFIGLKGTHQKAIAWQPLPQPYKKEGTENE